MLGKRKSLSVNVKKLKLVGVTYHKISGGAEKFLIDLLQRICAEQSSDVFLYVIASRSLYKVENRRVNRLGESSLKAVLSKVNTVITLDLKLGLKCSLSCCYSHNIIISERANPLRFNLRERLFYSLLLNLLPIKIVFQTSKARSFYKIINYRKTSVIANHLLLKKPGVVSFDKKVEVLIIGRICEEKGWDNISMPLHLLNKFGSKITINIVGNGPWEFWIDRAQFNNLTFKKYDYTENPEEFYAKCSLLLAPSPLEGYPNIIYEAMRFGMSILTLKSNEILTDIASLGNLVVNDWNELKIEDVQNLISNRNAIGFNNYRFSIRQDDNNFLEKWTRLMNS